MESIPLGFEEHCQGFERELHVGQRPLDNFNEWELASENPRFVDDREFHVRYETKSRLAKMNIYSLCSRLAPCGHFLRYGHFDTQFYHSFGCSSQHCFGSSIAQQSELFSNIDQLDKSPFLFLAETRILEAQMFFREALL